MTASLVNLASASDLAQERKRQEEIDGQWDRLPAADMADCIASGLCGLPLSDALHKHFPSTPRADVYLAVGLAVALLQADLTIARMELDLLRKGKAAA
ncbi:MAG: hypothetical protein EBS42_15570 [Caulobacteraceae bacterium]|nr:hypothetical protein [Caulobacteraceae bacterium]